jgi:hypothetical protein
MRIPIASPSLRENIADPQSPQNHFSAPSSGAQRRSLSSPAVIRNDPGVARAFADAAAPVRR